MLAGGSINRYDHFKKQFDLFIRKNLNFKEQIA